MRLRRMCNPEEKLEITRVVYCLDHAFLLYRDLLQSSLKK